MAQFNWLYLGENGRKYNVGLFHGDRTGHLMVMCNARIVLIDFGVQQAKDYSFFIDDELFELSVEGKPGAYAYNCSINEDADTPRNRIRKKQKRLDFRKSVAIITMFALVIIGALGFAVVNQKAEPPPVDQAALLSREGMETIARIHLDKEALKDDSTNSAVVSYSFVANGHVRNFEQTLESTVINGFPLESGDEFRVKYLLKRPKQHRLDFDQPTKQQLKRYVDRTIRKHQDLNPDFTNRQARCRVEAAYRLGGMEALAVLFHQNTPQRENADFNKLIYQKFTRDIPFQKAVEKDCW